MKKTLALMALCVIIGGALWANPCASQDYDTQKGGAIGAIGGQAIGRDTAGTLTGAADGALVGAVAGNAVEQTDTYVRLAQAQPNAPQGYGPPPNASSGIWPTTQRFLRDTVHHRRMLRDTARRLTLLRDMARRRRIPRHMAHHPRMLRVTARRHMHLPLPLMWFPYRGRALTSFRVSVSTSSFTRATGTDPSEAAGMERHPTMDHGCTWPVQEFPASFSHCPWAGAGFRRVTAPYPTQS